MWVSSLAETSTATFCDFFFLSPLRRDICAFFILSLASPETCSHFHLAKCYKCKLTIIVVGNAVEWGQEWLICQCFLVSSPAATATCVIIRTCFPSFTKFLIDCERFQNRCQISTKNIIALHRRVARHLRLILNRFPSFSLPIFFRIATNFFFVCEAI